MEAHLLGIELPSKRKQRTRAGLAKALGGTYTAGPAGGPQRGAPLQPARASASA
jgi:hypothetical protein